MSHFTALKVKEVHSGVIHKVGGRVKSWNKRWMVLNSDHMLHYYKDASKPSLGAISIADPEFDIRTGVSGDVSWPKQCRIENTLVITTKGRTYYMFAETKDEAVGWMTAITNARSLCGTTTHVSNSLPDRYNKMGGKADNLATPSALPSSPRKTPKPYKQKDRRLPTKRFNSMGDNEEQQSHSESEEEVTNDGELSRNTPNSVPPVINSIEGLYDLVTATDDSKTITSPNHLSVPSPNGGRDRNDSQLSYEERDLKDSVCINESLYDLVGRINAGEDIDTTKQGQPDELYEPINEPQQELYESINNNENNQPKSPTSPKLPPLPPLPQTNKKKQEQLYDSVTEHFNNGDIGGDMYEDVERFNKLAEAELSDDDDTVPLPNNLPSTSLPPPPLPPRIGQEATNEDVYINNPKDEVYINSPSANEEEYIEGSTPLISEEMYDNAPSLPFKKTSLQENAQEIDEEYYGNASSLPHNLRPISPPPMRSPQEPKKPKPLPRSQITSSHSPSPSKYTNSEEDIEEPDQELYDDIQVVIERDVTKMNGHEEREEEKEDKEEEQQKEDKKSVGDSTVIILRDKSPLADRRVHSATVGSGDAGKKGIEMFYRRKKEIVSETEETSIKKQVKDLFLAEKKEAILSSEDKVVLAETLREIETEKQLASEEKFKWERERLKFEEDRRKFERERQQLLDELAKAKAQLETQK